MAQNRVPFLTKQDVRRTDGTNASHLLDGAPVLEQAHQTCNAVVRRRVHQLIHNVTVWNAEMRKRSLVIVHHDGNRPLILNLLADRLSGQLTVIHIIRKDIGFLLFLGRLLFLLALSKIIRMCSVRNRLKSVRRNSFRCTIPACHNGHRGHHCQYYCKYSLLHDTPVWISKANVMKI